MALTTELLTVLDNNEEPLEKRLRIAKNAFNSNELSAFNTESLILDWITKTSALENNDEVWKTLNSCLSQEHIQNDIKLSVLKNTTTIITKQLQIVDGALKIEIMKCATIILKNEIFQHYFKHDTKRFCHFIGTFLLNINDINELKEIFQIYCLFEAQIIVDDEYTKNFLKFVLNALLDILIKFDDLFENCVQIIQHIFINNDFKKMITNIFQKDVDEQITNNVMQKLDEIYENDKQKTCQAYKLFFVAFVNVYKNDTLEIYQFLILIIRNIGFKFSKLIKIGSKNSRNSLNYDLDVSLNITAELLEIISKENISINNSTIDDVKFSDFFISFLISIIDLNTKPSLSILKIIKNLIIIEPVVITKTISEIMMFLLKSKNDETKCLHSQLMISLFEMYLKLHRLHKFCSELIQSIYVEIFSQKKSRTEIKFGFSGHVDKLVAGDFVCSARDLFPENVVHYFQECITLQSNKQIISIMRTFIKQLNNVTEYIKHFEKEKTILYIEILSDLTCQFLSAVRIAEHTTTEITIDKFFKDINDLKIFLKNFGTALLKIEHTKNLMFSFLNLCYNWGENAILLNYYIPNDKSLIEGLAVDNSANNLTYLHNYLSTDQWSLVSQRIKNFGEKRCKRILQKLIIQKLRAVLLFEPDLNENLESSVISSYSSNLENCWDIIFTERFVTAKFFIKMQNSQLVSLADLLINDVLTRNNYKLLANKNIIDSRDLTQSILFVCLSKINDLFKKKRRHSDTSSSTITQKALTRKIFECIDQDSFIRNESINIEKIIQIFNDNDNDVEYNTTNAISISKCSLKFNNLMEIIKNIPVYSLSHEIQITLFLFLLSICMDLQHTHSQTIENNCCKELCEKYLIALVENTTSPNVLHIAKSHILMRNIIENTQKYKEILNFCVNKTLKENESIPGFKIYLNLLLKHIFEEKYFHVALITFHWINKMIKYKITEKNKEHLRKYKEKLYKRLFDVVMVDYDQIEGYYLVLQKCLSNNKDKEDAENLKQLLSVLNKYIDYSFKNINETNAKGCLLLYELILTKKSNINDIPSNFVLSVWRSCKDLRKNDDYSLNFDQTITLLFELISFEQFPMILDDLSQSTTNYLKNNELDKIKNQFDIWGNLINSAISSVKAKLCQNSLQSMLEEVMVYIINNNTKAEFCSEYVKLLINIMENKKIPPSSNIIDIYLQTSRIIISKEYNEEDFPHAFDTSFSLLESFIKHRKILLVDRLPAFLIQLRYFIIHLTTMSNSDDKNLDRAQILKIANCAFRVEQLIKNICSLKKDMARVAPYLIAEILRHYEKITLYPEVKNHFNNSVNYLIDLCDSHSVSYLLRMLSTGSREIFKNMHENYKKYYKFTGKV